MKTFSISDSTCVLLRSLG